MQGSGAEKENHKMSKAYNRFESIMDRCERLIANDYTNGRNDDILRSTIVFAVVAMERYLKERFMESFIAECKENKFSNPACVQLLKNIGISETYWRDAALSSQSRPCKTLANKVRKYLMTRLVVQNSMAISNLYACFGMGGIVENAVGKCNKKTIWGSISKLIDRRHLIAHNADLSLQGCLRPINCKMVSKWLMHLNEFIEGVEFILDCRFSKKGKGEKSGKRKIMVSTVKEIRQKGYIDAINKTAVARISDIAKLFNVDIPMRGFQYPGAIAVSYGDCVGIWWPRIGKTANKAGWKNEVSYDDKGLVCEIREWNVNKKSSNKVGIMEMGRNESGEIRRITFANLEGEACDTGYCYRFLGLFDLDEEVSRKEGVRVWRRVNSRIEFVKG